MAFFHGRVIQAQAAKARSAMPVEALAVRKTLAERSLRAFIKYAWHVVEPSRPYIEGRHIVAIAEHLEAVSNGQIKNLLINIPPGCMKSLLVGVLWPTWEWCRSPSLGNEPAAARWMFASYDARLSTRDSLKRRKIFDSEWYQSQWGDNWTWLPDQNEKTKYENNRTGWMSATSVAGGATGEHPNRVVVDDPINVEQSYSEEFIERANRWFDGTIGSRGVLVDVSCVVTMQRLRENDTSGHILKYRDDFTHICLPMRYETGRMKTTSLGFNDWRTTEGELLWPEGFTEEKAKVLENRLGVMQVPGQLQQRPSRLGGQIFKRTQFRYFRIEQLQRGVDELDDESRMLREGHSMQNFVFVLDDGKGVERRYYPWDCWWFQTIDTASSEGDGSAYTVVTTVAVTEDNRVLVYDVVRERIEFSKQFNFLREQKRRYPQVEKQHVEKASTGIALISTGKMNGMPFAILEATGSKETRAGAIATMYENGMVYHLYNAPWLLVFEDEMLSFPRGEFKDQVDTMSYVGIEIVTRRGFEPRIRTMSQEEAQEMKSIDELMGDF